MYGTHRDSIVERIPRVVDNTILSTFRNCQHKALWEHIFKLTPTAPSVHLHAGSCFSKALETLYRSAYGGSTKLEALARANFAFEKAWGDFTAGEEGNKSKERVWQSVESYAAQYDPPGDYIAPAAAFSDPFEYSFAIPLTKDIWGLSFPAHPSTGEPFLYAGRFDMIGEHAGQLRIRDDKLTTQLGANWDRSWTLRSQFIGYVACMQALGHSLDTVEIRGVQPLKETINHKTAVKSYSNDVIWRWMKQIQRDLSELVRVASSEDWAHNFSEICSAYGGCPFLDLCRASSPEDYFDTFAKRDWNPLEVRA